MVSGRNSQTYLISGQVGTYLDSLVPPRPSEMQDMEDDARKTGFPIVGPASGFLCYQMARLMNARQVFEMGSGYGYSTAWFARAVKENGGGMVHHVVWDAELSARARRHLHTLELEDAVEFHVGEAVQALRSMPGPFDLVFNDIDKEGYAASLAAIEEKLRPGGLLIIDNMLWSGRIFDQGDRTASTHSIRELTRLLTRDSGWITTLVPVRDGLMLAYRQNGR